LENNKNTWMTSLKSNSTLIIQFLVWKCHCTVSIGTFFSLESGWIHRLYVSVRKVVPTLTSNERWDLPLDGSVLATNRHWVYHGSGRGRTFSSGVLGEGGYKRGGRGGVVSKSLRFWLRQVPISWGRRRACEGLLSVVLCPRGRGTAPPFIGQGGSSLHACRTVSLRVEV
jgi:hypothetical protein